MRISSVSSSYQRTTLPVRKQLKNSDTANISQQTDVFEKSEVSFKGKHECAKFLGGLCGIVGTAGAIGGMIIMTGGLGAATIPWIIGYGGLSAASGAIIGHQLEKGHKDDNDSNGSNNK